jgi:hypothetical protein
MRFFRVVLMYDDYFDSPTITAESPSADSLRAKASRISPMVTALT